MNGSDCLRLVHRGGIRDRIERIEMSPRRFQ
jgi:hypothetical protein